MAQPPNRVMRFYGNLQYTLETIALKQITFLHVDRLNDPFDANLSFETDFDDDYQTLINYAQQYYAKDFETFIMRLPKENWDGFLADMERHFNNSRNSSFIFSTSEVSETDHPKDNLYMWSHYGNGHRGVALEFDTHFLAKAVLQKVKVIEGEEVNLDEVWSEINYVNEVPKITCEHIINFVINDVPIPDEKVWSKTQLADILSKRYSSKNIGWQIENEWRLAWHNDETRLKIQRLDLIEDNITALYLGLRYPLDNDNSNDDLIFEMRRNFPKAKIFKAMKGKGKSILDFKQIMDSAN